MKLKSSNTLGKTLEKRIKDIHEERDELLRKLDALKIEEARLSIHPYDIGDTVEVNLPKGRGKAVQRAVIECDSGNFHFPYAFIKARPFKSDGTLSGRSFYISREDIIRKAE